VVSEQETFSILTAKRVSIVVVSDGRLTQRVARSAAIEQPIDQVQVARAAAAGTNSRLAGQVRFGARGKGGDLFVSHLEPLDLALPSHGVGQPIWTVTDNAVDAFYSRCSEGARKLISNSSWHAHHPGHTGATQVIAIPTVK
jgi:hypothetical protein